MSGLDTSSTQPTKSEDQGGSGVDQKHERSSITDSSESSQTPSTPRSFNVLTYLCRLNRSHWAPPPGSFWPGGCGGRLSPCWGLFTLVAVMKQEWAITVAWRLWVSVGKCWRAFPALFLLNYCFTFSVTTEDTLFIMSVRFNDVKTLPGRLCRLPTRGRRRNTGVASLARCHPAAAWSILFSSAHLCCSCRQEKDSKDEVAKAEKELEEIHKVIEESGGKLSNRVLQCDVRLRCLFSGFRSARVSSPANRWGQIKGGFSWDDRHSI